MNLAGERVADQTLEAYLAVFTHHYLHAKSQQPVVWDGVAHQRLHALSLLSIPRRSAAIASSECGPTADFREKLSG